MKKCVPRLWAFCLGFAIASPAFGDDNQTVGQRLVTGLLASTPGTATVESYLSSLTPSGSWGDITYSSTAITDWSPATHLSRLEAMCQDYANSASGLYHNASLATGISSAYNYWVTVDPQSANWYDNQIVVPQDMGSILLLIESGTNASGIVSSSQLTAGTNEIYQAYVPRSDYTSTNTAENRVNRALACIDLGVLTSSSTMTSSSFGAISDTLAFTTSDGIQADYSFHQHGPQLYGGGYGMEFGSGVAAVCLLGASTSFAFSTSSEQALANYLVNGQQWFCRGISYDYTAMGRYITFSGMGNDALGLIPAVQDMLQASTYDQSQLQSMLTRLQTASSTGAATPSLALSGNRSFFSSDSMVNQRPAWYASVKVSSVRTYAPETGNGQGLQSLYMGSGVTMIEVTGNEYENIFPVWNWRRLPGTTVEQNTLSLTPTASWGVYGTSTYAGGVSNDTYGCEAFSYSQGNVSALKSWFYFDNEFVALGAGINAPNATSPVITTLNQCLLTGPVTYATTSGGTQSLGSGTANSGNLSWVYQGGVGYLFPSSPSSATIMAIAQSGTWYSINTALSKSTTTANVFSLQINHPSQPVGASYSYIVVPGTTVAGMAAYAAAYSGSNAPVTILRNDTTVQAVENASLGLTEAAFYSSSGTLSIAAAQNDSGENYWVTPSAPALLLLQQSSSGLTITASNPLAAALNLQIEVGLPLANAWNPAAGYSTVTLNLAGGSLGGSSVSEFFAYSLLTWDTAAGSGGGRQAGSGTWSNSPSLTSWTTSPSGANALSWTDSGNANFSASGTSSIAVQGTVNVNNITISGTGYSFSGGTLNVLGGIQSTVNANIASAITLAASQTWLASTSGQTLTVAGNIANNGNLLTLGGAGNVLLAGAISGSGGLAVTGSGTYTLASTANTYTGGTTIGGGTLAVGVSNAVPTSSTVIFAGNSFLNVGPNSQTVSGLTVANSYTGTVSGGGHLTVSATGSMLTGANASGANTQTLLMSNLGDFTYSGSSYTFDVGGEFSGSSGSSAGAGTVWLTGSNSITANTFGVASNGSDDEVTTNSSSGAVYLGRSNTINAVNVEVAYNSQRSSVAGTLQFAPGSVNPTLTIDGLNGPGNRANVTLGNIGASSFSQYATGTIDLVTGVTGTSQLSAYVNQLILGYHDYGNNGHPATGTFNMGGGTLDATTIIVGDMSAGSVAGGSATGAFSLNGGTVLAGTITLAANSPATAGSASGAFNLNSGLVSATLIGSGSGAGTCVFNWSGGTIANYDPGYGLGGDSANSSLTVSVPTLTMSTGGAHTFWIDAGQTGLVSSTIVDGGGSASLTKAGGGLLTLSHSNTYSGGTTISGGTLDINADAALGAGTAAVTFSADGTLQASGTVTLNPSRPIVIDSGATATLDTQSGKMTVEGAISGAGGALMKVGTGLLVLSGSNSYTGGTIVEAGTLEVTTADALAAGTSLIVGADATSVFGAAVSGSSPADSPALAGPAGSGVSAALVPEPGTLVLFIAVACAAGVLAAKAGLLGADSNFT